MSLYRIVFTWLALGSLALAVAPANRTPYISIYYVQPTVNVGDAATIDYYVTDFHQKEYLDDDVSERFTIEYWVNGVRSVLTDVPAGDQSLNLGVLPQGNVLFAFQATDRLGVKSHRLYQEFRVVDPAEMELLPEQVLYPDLAAFNISSNDTQPIATTQGLTDLILWASTNGYRKVVLPHGRYRIWESNTVSMASGVTLDMNGSTFKLNPNALAKALMLEFVDCYDAHVINGIFAGDLLEHDFENAPNNSEWVHALRIAQGSEYSSVENVVITNVTGYGSITRHNHTYNGLRYVGDTFVLGDIDEAGEDIPSMIRTTNTNYVDIERYVTSCGFIQLGLYLGYQGNPVGDWIYKAHFYDASMQYIESIEGYLYRRLYPPANARYARFTLYSTRQPAKLGVFNFRSPYNCVFRNIHHVNIRCVGMALTGINNFLVEGCRFDNCGWASAKCAFDAEDGWDLMQDLTFRGNVFGANPRNEFLTCAGHNFVMEDNIMKSYIYDRTYSYVVRNNAKKSAVYKYGTRARTGYPRVHSNVNNGLITMTSVTTDADKPQAVRNDVCNAGVSGNLERSLKFYRSEIRDGKLNAYAEQCIIENIDNAGGSFEIVDSVVSNSLLKQSNVTVARVEGSHVVNSRLYVQGGLIIATSNHLIDTDCVIGGSWQTNSAFQLTGNVIDTTNAAMIAVGNTFKYVSIHSNIINSSHANFHVLRLTNPNFSGSHPGGSMFAELAGNVFNANGGTALIVSYVPNAICTLFANLHYNVYNNIDVHSANIADKPNVILSVLPVLPTVLEVILGATAVPGNAGAEATTVTVTRYMNTDDALTVYLTSSDPTLLSVPTSVVIPAGQTSVTFTLSTIHDPSQAGHQAATITASADGFAAGTASIEIQDDKLADVIIEVPESPFQLTEGASTTYTVALATVPAAPVTVTPVPPSPLLISPATLPFTAADWDVPQTFTVTYPDSDTLVYPPCLLAIDHALLSTDTAYDALAIDPIPITILDNDLPTLTLTAAATTLSEADGNAATTVTVSRNTPVFDSLSVVLTSSLPAKLRVGSPAVIPQGERSVSVPVDAIDNDIIEPTVFVEISAATPGFIEGSTVIAVLDDDTPPSAITNVVVYAESFETSDAGAPLLPARGWYSGATPGGVVVREPYAYSKERPLDTTHLQHARIKGGITNRIVRVRAQPTWIDMMLAPHLGNLGSQVGEDETGFQFSENGILMLFHRDLAGATNRWTQLEHRAITEGAWVRLTVAVDYETENPVHPGIRYLRLFLDGVALDSHAAYTANDGSGLPGGFWFPIYHQLQAPVSEISFHDGTCYLDDLTVTTIIPQTPGGIPWSWLAQYGLSSSDAESDFDNDGFTAGQEYIAGTDPNDSECRFVVQSIDATTDTVQIGVQSVVGRIYTLERRTALDVSSPWLPVSEMTDMPGTGGMLWLYAHAASAGFFRVRVRLE